MVVPCAVGSPINLPPMSGHLPHFYCQHALVHNCRLWPCLLQKSPTSSPQIYSLPYSKRDQKSNLIRRLLIDISQHTLAHTALCCVPTVLRLDRDPKPSPCPTGSAPATLTFLSSISPATSCKGLTHLLPFSWVNPHLSTFTSWRKPSLIGSVALM